MRGKIIIKFVRKVLTGALFAVIFFGVGIGIILFSQWMANNISLSDSTMMVALGVIVVIGLMLWLFEQYKESVKEVEYESRCERFNQQRERVEQNIAKAQEDMST